MKKKTDYSKVLPSLVEVLPDRIVFVYDGLGISLNHYKKMHYSQIKKYRLRYKAITDMLLLTIVKPDNYRVVDGGIELVQPLFDSCSVRTTLSFSLKRFRDVENYIQKVLIDGITDTNLLEDDNYTILKESTVTIDPDIREDKIRVEFIGSYKHELIVKEYNIC